MATNIRFQVIGVTTLAAVLLYLDRVCIAEIAKLDDFKQALDLSQEQTGAILSAFFLSYALCQMPAGWLSDRFGARRMLPLYIVIWSLCTILTGVATGFAMLITARLLFGVAQAGCYPTASSLIKRWVPLPRRGTASSVVSFGGRVGGALAPVLTALLLTYLLSWRWVMVLYGGCGVVAALLFYRVVREHPDEHPGTDDDERALIRKGDSESGNVRASLPPIREIVGSRSMWLMSLLQFGNNVGWVFLVTWLPTYLKEVKNVDSSIGGMMSSIVLTAGIAGMLCGGPLTDFATGMLGRRWGRALPMIVCYVIAIAAYFSCLQLESAWAFIVAASLVAFVTDMSVPAIWAFMQDVGGKNTAAVFGWGNMWGNLGAATIPILVPWVREHWDSNGDWHEVFLLFSLGYLLAALAAIGINSNRKVGN